jgi:hypothetical protein
VEATEPEKDRSAVSLARQGLLRAAPGG